MPMNLPGLPSRGKRIVIGDPLHEEPQTREQQVLHFAAQGMTDKEIAKVLGISRETVLTYWRRIRLRHGSASRTEVVAKALQQRAANKIGEVEEQNQELLFEIAERKRVENLLIQASSRLRTLMDSMSSGVLFEDDNGNVAFVNQAFCEIFGIPFRPKEMVGTEQRNMIQRIKGAAREPNVFAGRLAEIASNEAVVTAERFRLANGRVIELDFLPIESGAPIRGFLWHFRDVTAAGNVASPAEGSLGLTLVAECARILVGAPHEVALTEALDLLGSGLQTDRAYICLESAGTHHRSIQWCAPGIEPRESGVPQFSGMRRAWWLKHLLAHDCVRIDSVENLPAEAETERKVLDAANVKAVVLAPIAQGKKFLGYVGLESVTHERAWDSETLAILGHFADLVAAHVRASSNHDDGRDARPRPA